MDVLYAPYERLSPGASHVWADWVFGGVLLLCAAWAFLLAWNAWVHAIALHKQIWQARGLRPGVIMLAGVAEPVESERSDTDGVAPFVELTIHQRGEQRRTKNGQYILWKETARSLCERTFLLRTDAGTLVRVEPSGHVDLVDRLEPAQRSGIDRVRFARIVPGERVWVRGHLATVSAGDGPYRGDGQVGVARHTLRPARDRPLFISSEPVDREERSTARFHALFGVALLATLACAQLVVFSNYRALRSRGTAGTAPVANLATWVTHNKRSTTNHYGLELYYAVDGLVHSARVEVNRTAYQAQAVRPEPASVPIVYDWKSPGTMQVGGPREVGLTRGLVLVAACLASVVLGAWIAMSLHRRPWWRRKKLNETQPGTL